MTNYEKLLNKIKDGGYIMSYRTYESLNNYKEHFDHYLKSIGAVKKEVTGITGHFKIVMP